MVGWKGCRGGVEGAGRGCLTVVSVSSGEQTPGFRYLNEARRGSEIKKILGDGWL